MLLSRPFVLSRPWASGVTLATQGSMPPAPSLHLPVQVCLSSRNALTTPLDQFTAKCVGPRGRVKLTREVTRRRMVEVFRLPSRVAPVCPPQSAAGILRSA